MNKNLKNCFFSLFIILIILSCSGASLLSGISIGKLQSEKTNEDSTIVEQGQITEKPVYYEQTTSQRYIDENSPSNIYTQLLKDAEIHFTFEFNVQDENQFLNDKNFILANLENQYSRLSIKFNKNITNKIKVKLVDNIDIFQNDLNIILEGDGVTSYSAFALGGDLIEIYINPFYTAEKFDIAHTLSHELVHIFHYQVNSTVSSYNPNWATANWFIEGMAEGFAFPHEDPLIHSDIYKVIPDTSALNDVVDSPDPGEYMIGYDAVELFFLYLSNTYGEDKMIELAKCTITFDQCFTQTIGISPDDAYINWLKTI